MIFRLVDIRAQSRTPDREIRELGALVAKDYERRMNGSRPDRFHWADEALLMRGWVVRGE